MNPKIFDQSTEPWGSKAYPTLPCTVKTDGCGLCAITNVVIESNNYWDSTPMTFYSFMRQFAVYNNGTLRKGIPLALKQFLGNSKEHYVASSMQSVWNELAKGHRVAIFLFGGGTAQDGTEWTIGGHYVAITDYKYKGGDNWVYTKDSSWRHHDGWYSYSKSIRGLIPEVAWTAIITGWYREGDDWIYLDSNGTPIKNGWAKDRSKKWFYLGSDGKMVKSKWVKWKDNWYFLKADGSMAENEWAKDSKGWCYLGKGGKMLKGCWVRWKNNMYYLDGSGRMVTGSRNVPCAFDANGKLVVNNG